MFDLVQIFKNIFLQTKIDICSFKIKKEFRLKFFVKIFWCSKWNKKKNTSFLKINYYLIYIKQSKEISDLILQYIDDEENSNENFTQIINYIKKLDEEGNREIIRSSLKVISALSRNHNRKNGLIDKIEKIIVSIRRCKNLQIIEFAEKPDIQLSDINIQLKGVLVMIPVKSIQLRIFIKKLLLVLFVI